MSFTVQDVITECQEVFLNDAAGSIITAAKLIPFVRRAYDDAQRVFELFDAGVKREVTAPFVIPANTIPHSISLLGYQTSPALPVGFLYPLYVEELAPGATVFQPMEQEEWPPNTERTDMLRWWIYMGGEIRFLGATRDVTIRLKYIEGWPTISGTGDTILIVDTLKSFLSARASSYFSFFKGQNPTRATACEEAASAAMASIRGKLIHVAQQVPTRLRPFRRPRRMYMWRR